MVRSDLATTYDGRLVPYARLTAVTGLLAIATLGVYRFWGRTRVRRYVWSRIRLGGDRLEYTGTGRELFIGFLRVAALFAGLALVSRLAQFAPVAGPVVQGLSSLVATALYLSVPYFSRRYRLCRTRWRGVAFELKPCLGAYAWCRLRFGLLTLLTLGMLAPIDRIKTEALLIRNTRFGDRAFACKPRVLPALGWWCGAWLLVVLATAVAGRVLAQPIISAIAIAMATGQTVPLGPVPGAASLGLAGGLLLPAAVCYVIYRVTVQRTIVEAIHCGRVRFVLPLRYGAALRIAAVQIATTALVFLLLVGGALAQWLGTKLTWPAVAAALVSWFAMRWIADIAWVHGYLRRQLPRLAIIDADELATVRASGAVGPARGDGLAAYFDFAT